MALKDKIDLFRCQSGLTIDELAAKSGISISTIKKISAGITKDPQIETLRAIAHAMGKTLSDFDDDYTIEKSVGRRIKARRKALGMNAEKLATLIGASPATVYRYEKGDIEKISCTLLESIANALNTSTAYLMGWTDNPDEHALFVGQRLKELRVSAGLSVDELVECTGKSRATIYRYESGEIDDIPANVIVKLAGAFHVSPAYLMGWTDYPDGESDFSSKSDFDESSISDIELPSGAIPIERRRIPLLGSVHTTPDNFFESYVECGSALHCDYALRVVGDSMINARIFDGDIVFISKQDTVDNGEIAAVLIDDETTLKRVRFMSGNITMFLPENNAYQPIIVGGGDETREVRILGKAIAFQSNIR